MAYAPNVLDSAAPLAGSSGFVAALATQHNDVYAAFAPTLLCVSRTWSTTNNTKPWLRFRVRGNADLHPIQARVRASSSGGSSTLSLSANDATVATASVSADAYYTLAVTPTGAVVQDCALSISAGVGVTASFTRANARLAPSVLTGAQPSGWINGEPSYVVGADYAENVEYVDRLERGPLLIARDRPLCAFHHLIEPYAIGAVGSKSLTAWAHYNSSAAAVIGRGIMPRVDRAARRYIVDAWVSWTSGSVSPSAELRVGGLSWQIPAFNQWVATEVVLPPGPHLVTASLTPGLGSFAAFESVQIWRA